MQDAELAITLLYELGEGASEDAMKPGTGALAQLAQGEAQHMWNPYPSGGHITTLLISSPLPRPRTFHFHFTPLLEWQGVCTSVEPSSDANLPSML